MSDLSSHVEPLLGERMAPLTFTWSFLEAGLDAVRQEVVPWLRSTGRSVRLHEIAGDLEQLLSTLIPLSMPPTKALWSTTQSGWLAQFDNGSKGGDVTMPIPYLSRRLNVRGLVVSCRPHLRQKASQRFYSTVFALYGPGGDALNCIRSIFLGFDGGKLRFGQGGAVLPFERVEQYSNPEVRLRLTPALVQQYARALGIELFDVNFYGPKGLLLDWLTPACRNTVSLRQAQEQLGLTSE
jgi:hypothetical protein